MNLEAIDKSQRVADDSGNEIFLPPARGHSFRRKPRSLKKNGLGLDQMEFLGGIEKTAELWEKGSSSPHGLQKTSSN